MEDGQVSVRPPARHSTQVLQLGFWRERATEGAMRYFRSGRNGNGGVGIARSELPQTYAGGTDMRTRKAHSKAHKEATTR